MNISPFSIRPDQKPTLQQYENVLLTFCFMLYLFLCKNVYSNKILSILYKNLENQPTLSQLMYSVACGLMPTFEET